MAPAELPPSPRPGHRRCAAPVTKTTIPEKIRILEARYAHELLPEEERLELRERILKLKKKIATTAGRS